MHLDSVIVDVAVDQGGVVESCLDRVTLTMNLSMKTWCNFTHAVANIPGAVARTSTLAFNKCNTSYIEAFTDKVLEQAIADDLGLQQGVTTYKGYLTSRPRRRRA